MKISVSKYHFSYFYMTPPICLLWEFVFGVLIVSILGVYCMHIRCLLYVVCKLFRLLLIFSVLIFILDDYVSKYICRATLCNTIAIVWGNIYGYNHSRMRDIMFSHFLLIFQELSNVNY